MKKLLAVAGVGLVVAAGASAYMGRTLSQQAFDNQLAQIHQYAPLYRLTVEQARLEHSLFGGQAHIELFFDPSHTDMPPLFLVLESDLQYGPLLLTDKGVRLGLASGQSRLALKGLPEPVAQKLNALLGYYLLTADSHVDFSRQMESDLRVPAVNFKDASGAVDFAGMQVHISSDTVTQRSRGQVSLGRMSLRSPEANIEILPAQGRFESSDLYDYLADGRFNLNFPEINVSNPDLDVSLKDLGINVKQAMVNGQLSISETLSVGEIIAPVPVSAVSATFEVDKLNPESVELWTKMAAQLANPDPASGLPDIDPQRVRALVSALFQPGLQFNQRYDVAALGGRVQAGLAIEYVGLANGLHPMDVQSPMQLLNAVDATLRLDGDEQVIMALPIAPAVPQYVAQGLVKQEQQKLRVEARLVGGQLRVNGVPFPLDGLLSGGLAQH